MARGCRLAWRNSTTIAYDTALLFATRRAALT